MKLYKRILRHPMVEYLIVLFGVFLLKALKSSISFERLNFEKSNERTSGGEGSIYAFWHGRMLMMPFAYSGREMYVLISLHSDGGLISKTMKRLKIHSVRGSSFKRAAGALREIQQLIKKGKDITFTPDGPRGPRERAQMGTIMAAKLGGVPIIPVSYSTSRRKFLSTWDRFLIPLPFSRGIFLCGPPITVPKNADKNLMESKRKELNKSLTDLGERCDNYFC